MKDIILGFTLGCIIVTCFYVDYVLGKISEQHINLAIKHCDSLPDHNDTVRYKRAQADSARIYDSIGASKKTLHYYVVVTLFYFTKNNAGICSHYTLTYTTLEEAKKYMITGSHYRIKDASMCGDDTINYVIHDKLVIR